MRRRVLSNRSVDPHQWAAKRRRKVRILLDIASRAGREHDVGKGSPTHPRPRILTWIRGPRPISSQSQDLGTAQPGCAWSGSWPADSRRLT